MRRFITLTVALVALAMALTAIPVYAEDNVIDKVGDWWSTRGKQEPEKSLILTQRKAERTAKRAEKELQKSSKEMQKSMKKAFGQ